MAAGPAAALPPAYATGGLAAPERGQKDREKRRHVDSSRRRGCCARPAGTRAAASRGSLAASGDPRGSAGPCKASAAAQDKQAHDDGNARCRRGASGAETERAAVSESRARARARAASPRPRQLASTHRTKKREEDERNELLPSKCRRGWHGCKRVRRGARRGCGEHCRGYLSYTAAPASRGTNTGEVTIPEGLLGCVAKQSGAGVAPTAPAEGQRSPVSSGSLDAPVATYTMRASCASAYQWEHKTGASTVVHLLRECG